MAETELVFFSNFALCRDISCFDRHSVLARCGWYICCGLDLDHHRGRHHPEHLCRSLLISAVGQTMTVWDFGL
jgi:hypothetical protein